MKNLIVSLLVIFVSTASYAEDKFSESKEQYDSHIKASGKWDFIGNFCMFTGVIGLGASYYSLSEMSQYTDKDGEPRLDLTEEEFFKYQQYDQIAQKSIGITTGSFLFGIIGYGMSAGYERDANKHALKFNIKF